MSQIGLYWYSVYHIFISIPLSLNFRQTNEGVEYENKVELLFHDTCTPIMVQCAISFLFWFLFCFFLYEAIDILNGSDRFASFVFSWMVFFVFRKRKKNHSFHIPPSYLQNCFEMIVFFYILNDNRRMASLISVDIVVWVCAQIWFDGQFFKAPYRLSIIDQKSTHKSCIIFKPKYRLLSFQWILPFLPKSNPTPPQRFWLIPTLISLVTHCF